MSTTTQKIIHGILKITGPMTPQQIRETSHYSRETVWRTVKELRETGQIRMLKEAQCIGGTGGKIGAQWEAIVDGEELEDVMQAWVRDQLKEAA